jgi:hypothetical protein
VQVESWQGIMSSTGSGSGSRCKVCRCYCLPRPGRTRFVRWWPRRAEPRASHPSACPPLSATSRMESWKLLLLSSVITRKSNYNLLVKHFRVVVQRGISDKRVTWGTVPCFIKVQDSEFRFQG